MTIMNIHTQELLSVVVPLYNEQDNVLLLTQKIHESLVGYQYEIIYIDDFSTDQTKKVVNDLADNQVHLIALKKNYGQSLALAAGIDTLLEPILLPWMVTFRTTPQTFLLC